MGSRFRVQAEGLEKSNPSDLFLAAAKPVSLATPEPKSSEPQPSQNTSNTQDGGWFAWLQVLACFLVLMNTWYAQMMVMNMVAN